MDNELVALEAQTNDNHDESCHYTRDEFLTEGVSVEEMIELAELMSAAETD